jgi:hypothetical protein
MIPSQHVAGEDSMIDRRRFIIAGNTAGSVAAFDRMRRAQAPPAKGGIVRIGMAGAGDQRLSRSCKFIDLHMFVASWVLCAIT